MRRVIRVTTGDSRKGRLGVIFVFSVCIHVCIFGGVEIECYLSIQGMYGNKKHFLPLLHWARHKTKQNSNPLCDNIFSIFFWSFHKVLYIKMFAILSRIT